MGSGACSGEDVPETVGTVRVAVPVSPIAGLVRALAPRGDLDVVVMVPVGSNPATHAPSIRDQRRAAEATLFLEIGHPAFVFESTWLDGILDGSSAERVVLFENCPVLDEDPHVWLSVSCLSAAAAVTAEALGRLFPAENDEISANLRRFDERLAAASESVDQRLRGHEGKSFVVLHPAWGYFARDHGLRQVEILSHASGDPGAARLAELIRAGRDEGVSTVFTQPQFNSAPAEIVADELGAGTAVLDPLQEDPIQILEEAAAALVHAFEARTP